MVATIVIAVVAAALAVALAVVARRAGAQRMAHATALADAQRERDERSRSLELLEHERSGLQVEVTHLGHQAADLRRSLDATRRELEEAEAATVVASSDAATSAAEAEALRRRLAEAGSGDAVVLWSLELARSARRWYHSVAPGPDARCPLLDSPDPLRTAVEIEAAALREESGARIEVRWDLEGGTPAPDRAILVLRVAQELLADAVRLAEVTELAVSTDGDRLVVSRRGLDEHEGPIGAPPLALPQGRAVAAGDIVTID